VADVAHPLSGGDPDPSGEAGHKGAEVGVIPDVAGLASDVKAEAAGRVPAGVHDHPGLDRHEWRALGGQHVPVWVRPRAERHESVNVVAPSTGRTLVRSAAPVVVVAGTVGWCWWVRST
jgi:hypothetical protein